MLNKIFVVVILGIFLFKKEYIVYNYELIIIIGLITLFYLIISNTSTVITEAFQKDTVSIENMYVEYITENINQLNLEKTQLTDKVLFYTNFLHVNTYRHSLIHNFIQRNRSTTNSLIKNLNYTYIQRIENIPLYGYTQLSSLINSNRSNDTSNYK